MTEQDLLPGNRVQSNETQQWLPAKGCAPLALLQSHDGFMKESDEGVDFIRCGLFTFVFPGETRTQNYQLQ